MHKRGVHSAESQSSEIQNREMQKTHRINIIAVWAAALVLSLLSFRNAGFAKEFFMSVGVMFGASLLAVALYFIPVRNTVRGTAIVSLIGLATLLLSILQGGSDRNFIASFFVLSLATLYFNSKIILGYGIIYMTACIAAVLVNPAYIDGTGYDMARVLIKVVIYFCVTAVLFLATRKGERLIAQSIENSRIIEDNAKQSAEISSRLHSSIINSNQGASSLSLGIRELKEEIVDAKGYMNEALGETSQMQNILSTSDMRMEQTAQYSRKLSTSFGSVSDKVNEGIDYVESAYSVMGMAEDQVSAAHKVTVELLHKMAKIRDILKEIDGVAQQTNILSVNAAIEAARSGEYGKGFSVVANEVRDLAIQSADASKDISSIVEELIAATNEVAAQVEAGDNSTQLGMEKMESLKSCFSLLKESTEDAGIAVRNEAAVIREFQDDYKEMRTGLERIADITRRNVKTTDTIADNMIQQNQTVSEIASQMEEISGVSSQLNSFGLSS